MASNSLDEPFRTREMTNPQKSAAEGRRSMLQIKVDILRVIAAGHGKPTQIMYRANLSWVALQGHLRILLARGLLRWVADGNRKRYELTTKGANVMYSYVKILEETGEDTTGYLEAGM